MKSPAPSMASACSVRNTNRTECNQCGQYHFRVCRLNDGTYFIYGSLDHFKRDHPKRNELRKDQNEKSVVNSTRGRRPGNDGSVGANKEKGKEVAAR